MPAQSLTAAANSMLFDFNTMALAELQRFVLPIEFTTSAVAPVHGIALWFDCRFPGSTREINLDTSPYAPLTHWYQVRCLLKAPLPAGVGHVFTGELRFDANESRGYNVHMSLTNVNTGVSAANTVVTQCALHHFQYSSQTSQSYYAPQAQDGQQAWAGSPSQSTPATSIS